MTEHQLWDIKADFENWKQAELNYVLWLSGPDSYSMAELEWDLLHSSYYNDDGDDAPFPGKSQ